MEAQSVTTGARSESVAKHPAKFSPTILDRIDLFLRDVNFKGGILDPFAGTGRIHSLATEGRNTTGIELEPEWADYRTIVGDCRVVMQEWLAYGHPGFQAIITSPVYGNRMADKDMRPSVGATYMKGLQREASAGSACHMQWGPQYRLFHEHVWKLCVALLNKGGYFILNCKDFYRADEIQPVTAWHTAKLMELGLVLLGGEEVETPHMMFGANPKRCPEQVIALVKVK
jgi:hypothetical protein